MRNDGTDNSVFAFYMTHTPPNTKECADKWHSSKEANILAKQSEVKQQVADIGHMRAVISGLNSLNNVKFTLGRNNLQNHSSRKGLIRHRTTKAQTSCWNLVPKLTEAGRATLPILMKITPYTVMSKNALNPSTKPLWICSFNLLSSLTMYGQWLFQIDMYFTYTHDDTKQNAYTSSIVNVKSVYAIAISVGIIWQAYRYIFWLLPSPNSPPYIIIKFQYIIEWKLRLTDSLQNYQHLQKVSIQNIKKYKYYERRFDLASFLICQHDQKEYQFYCINLVYMLVIPLIIIILAMQNNHSQPSADAESQFMANFVRRGQRKKCIYVQDTQSFLNKLQLFLKGDKVKENDENMQVMNPEQ